MQARILIQPVEVRSCFFLNEKHLPVVLEAVVKGRYLKLPPIVIPDTMPIEDVAEELFDLTNNPSRDDERQERYGNGPSLSSGDIVEVNGRYFVCMSFGWKEISVA